MQNLIYLLIDLFTRTKLPEKQRGTAEPPQEHMNLNNFITKQHPSAAGQPRNYVTKKLLQKYLWKH